MSSLTTSTAPSTSAPAASPPSAPASRTSPATPRSAPRATPRPEPRSTTVPAAAPARLLRCVGEPTPPVVDVRDGRASVPRHVAQGRPVVPTAPLPLSDPTALCCAVVRAAIEVTRGERTVQQLARWVTPEIYDAIARRARLELDTPGGTPTAIRPVTVRRARVMRIGAGAAEATVVVDDGSGRVRAAAARVEERRGTWRVVALEIG
ncbi:Rv3235 family protein [Cellulosimicrobium marinum]|uniref:Rv3235 family protein n=1 Tax=Cellulosimicrobium marinum TaxID=1638992 RepID=UPI001E636B63|nr:Rv3235 family protein [Cellulosimicrobium marinum]MCB7137233.1 Rv3235 family protein [Cellulosimicrobium marinum]